MTAMRSTQYSHLEIDVTTVSSSDLELGRVYLTDRVVWGGAAYDMASGEELLFA
jgi:hypothetical protein